MAVLDLEATDGKLKERGTQLAMMISTNLSTQDGVATVERQDLAKLLGEQELGNSGMIEPATAARIGHLTGARVLVTGRVFTVAGETTAVLKIMSTETGRVFGAAEDFSAEASPAGPAAKLAAKVGEILKTRTDALIAQPVTAEDRIARLKQKLAGITLPTVAISIPEQHIGPPVIDPAAETEIGLILSQAGFTLFAGEAAAKADFQIRGEAFSETGIRRGNLVSVRARVEVKVVAGDGGKVARIDRQVSWAVDTAEHIAAKMALQHAGAELAERIAEAVTTKN
ncbi:MAG: curli assembly protein CsgG [Opitutae bacterium]|nr:curli assembly protein CsgG [Opitutae bacterium]